ncbi:MAG: 3-isopropylmalate dehydratase small subunit [Candidatus Nitrosotenuis sp.]|uniref:3-isopropylmalate dehydratase small subunit 1 n=1 Tax=Candidatus Nitrosotenuis uzonensis TaxID=1407055 RepID=A0A812EX09_9ARCH|nr:3-isopropylmalate dehydratase small subunit [Candidatus Nitrosotenuis uzonensis]CAE6484616.1 3-isopropylmalate dehydratase small subunit 1 [Candidatus Nitrosotenuis uzonensis]
MTGKVIKYERDNIDTDVILPGQYLKLHDYDEIAKHAMEGIDPTFHSKVKPGDYIVAGKNFGCGSSREHAPIALSHCGIKGVLAISFARIFYRNAVDGAFLLPIEIDEQTYKKISDGDQIEVDTQKNQIKNITKNETYAMKPFSEIVAKIIEAGGLFKYKP